MSGLDATTNDREAFIVKVICGGETGADRAAVDFALSHHVKYGGWVPYGGWAEDYRDPPGLLATYPEFVATQSTDPAVRTTLNVRDSTATVVFSPPIATSRGVTQTLTMAGVLKRPITVIDPRSPDADALLETFLSGLVANATLNVAGPRESEVPGLYQAVTDLLSNKVNLFTTMAL
jgi:hypothetical protein